MVFSTLGDKSGRGFLDGQFLISMPNMDDGDFSRTVVYVCAHTPAGAMGFIINRAQPVSFAEVAQHLKLLDAEGVKKMPPRLRGLPVLYGGPVEISRGFVIHSDDFVSETSIPVSEDLSMTATLDILRAICEGKGPSRAVMLLGYSGWGPGQIEEEIANNGWLNCDADEGLIFDDAFETKHERALALLGVSPVMLSSEAGHA